MNRSISIERKSGETDIKLFFDLDGGKKVRVSSGIPFFDHMLTLFAVHGCFDLELDCKGDIEVDWHHSVEDIGIVLGKAVSGILGERKGIVRYGDSIIPMDESLCKLVLDLSNRPFFLCFLPDPIRSAGPFDPYLAKEFFRAFTVHAGANLHIDVPYGENSHHIVEAMFKAFGRALDKAITLDSRFSGVPSTKGIL